MSKLWDMPLATSCMLQMTFEQPKSQDSPGWQLVSIVKIPAFNLLSFSGSTIIFSVPANWPQKKPNWEPKSPDHTGPDILTIQNLSHRAEGFLGIGSWSFAGFNPLIDVPEKQEYRADNKPLAGLAGAYLELACWCKMHEVFLVISNVP